MPSRRRLFIGATLVLVAVSAIGAASWLTRPTTWTVTRLSGPARTEVRDPSGALLAELTDGARTVPLSGPVRRWSQPDLQETVVGDRWVRLLDAPFDGIFDAADSTWLTKALADRSPDLLALAFQYIGGAPDITDGGLRIAGDAHYGPTAGADFNDYLGVPWSYGETVDAPEASEQGALDCSGFVRMVLGYRLGLTMSIDSNGGSLPRRATDQLASGPGLVTVPNAGTQIISLESLRPGDLVFFDASDRDGTEIDHNGIYLGLDSTGHHRFISSRPSADGPTIGDVDGASIIDGTGYWARAFRAVRRP